MSLQLNAACLAPLRTHAQYREQVLDAAGAAAALQHNTPAGSG